MRLADVDGDAGDPLIKGTEIEVYRIAALLDGGVAPEDVLADYPSLTRDQVEFARAYAQANPNSGRSYPKQTFKAAIKALNLDALDDVSDDEAASH